MTHFLQTAGSKKYKRFSVYVLLCVILVGVLYGYDLYAKSQFEHAYILYKTVAGAQQNATFTPGADENSTREELNQTLAQMLSKDTTAQNRIQLSQKALLLINQVNTQIDAIGQTAGPVDNALLQLQAQANNPGNILRRNQIAKLIATAKKQMTLAEDIRGYSYRANFAIKQISTHLLDEKGILSDAYVVELNNELPDVEAGFTARQNAYTDFDATISTMRKEYTELLAQAW